MAEILLRISDKKNLSDPILDRQCSKAFDVIVVCADGWPWTAAEITRPSWRVIKLPGVSVDSLKDLVQNDSSLDGKILYCKRKMNLNIGALPTIIQNKIMNGPSPVSFNTIDAANIELAKFIKPSLAAVVVG